MNTRQGLAVAAAFALILLGVGSASGQVIHACVAFGGAVRLLGHGSLEGADECNRWTEKPISWDITGPPGPQGVQGLQGPRGPSDVYFTSGSATNSLPVAGGFPGNYTVVATLSLPAGTYVLESSPFVRNDDPTTPAIARCIMFVNSQSVGGHVTALTPSQGGGPYFGNVSIKSVRTLPTAGTVAVGCQKTDASADPGYGSNLVFAEGNYLIAQAVGTSHEQ